MSDDKAPVTVQIMDSEYRVACTPEEREALLQAANYLNDRMLDIRAIGKVLGTERIAVITALNIAHELLRSRQERHDVDLELSGRIDTLSDKLDMALNNTPRMEV